MTAEPQSPRQTSFPADPCPRVPNGAWAGDNCQRPPALPFGLPAAGYLVPLGSFILTSSGWLDLAVVIDLCSRRMVGWSLADHLRSDLVLAALRQALGTRPVNDAIFHSDRGSQYDSAPFRAALAAGRLRQSMSASANPYDNAWTESFIGTLKSEMLQNAALTTPPTLAPKFSIPSKATTIPAENPPPSATNSEGSKTF